MPWEEDDSMFDDNTDSRSRGEAFVPQPTLMVYAPPNRIMVRVPTLATTKAKSASLRAGSARVLHSAASVKMVAAPAQPPSLDPSTGPSFRQTSAQYQQQILQKATLPVARMAQRRGPQGRMVPHETNVAVTMDTAVPWFAVNVPRAASARACGGGGGARATLCQHSLTSHDVFGGKVKGWVEPSPDNVIEGGGGGGGSRAAEGPPVTDAHGAMRSPLAIATSARRVAPRSLLALPTVVLQKCFEYLPSTCLDGAVVHVCLRCYHAVRSSPTLTKLRFEFGLPRLLTQHSIDGAAPPWGILRYLASRRVGPTPAEVVLQQQQSLAASNVVSDNASLLNPCFRPNPTIQVVVVAPPRAEASGSWPQGPNSPSSYVPSPPRALRCAVSSAVTANQSSRRSVIISSGNRGFAPSEHFTSWGPSRFITPSIPYAWVGVELLQGYAVEVTGYAFCISDGSSAFPTAWELQGSTVATAPSVRGEASAAVWTETAERWRVLHKVEPHVVHSADRDSATQSSTAAIVAAPFETGCRVATFHVRPHRWGAMNRLRIVQTKRNSQWGHELPISGFEVYGSLSKGR
jgi:hypothetical protein